MKVTLPKLTSSKRRRLNPLSHSNSVKTPYRVNMKSIWIDEPTFNPSSLALISPSYLATSSQSVNINSRNRSDLDLFRVTTFPTTTRDSYSKNDILLKRNGIPQNINSDNTSNSRKRSPSTLGKTKSKLGQTKSKLQPIEKTSLKAIISLSISPPVVRNSTTDACFKLSPSCTEQQCLVCALTRPDLRHFHHRSLVKEPNYFRNFE